MVNGLHEVVDHDDVRPSLLIWVAVDDPTTHAQSRYKDCHCHIPMGTNRVMEPCYTCDVDVKTCCKAHMVA
eukprot:1712825-Amphidinium_carterae.1